MVWAGGVAGVTKAGGTNEGVRMLYIVEIRYNERGESSIRSSECVIDVNGCGRGDGSSSMAISND